MKNDWQQFSMRDESKEAKRHCYYSGSKRLKVFAESTFHNGKEGYKGKKRRLGTPGKGESITISTSLSVSLSKCTHLLFPRLCL